MSAPANPAWPSLPFSEWKDTCATLHMWTQIVGKTRLAFAPMENHWWQVALYVSERGLTTSRPSVDGTASRSSDQLSNGRGRLTEARLRQC